MKQKKRTSGILLLRCNHQIIQHSQCFFSGCQAKQTLKVYGLTYGSFDIFLFVCCTRCWKIWQNFVELKSDFSFFFWLFDCSSWLLSQMHIDLDVEVMFVHHLYVFLGYYEWKTYFRLVACHVSWCLLSFGASRAWVKESENHFTVSIMQYLVITKELP